MLCYHRVAEVETDPQLLAVTPRRLAEQLTVLQTAYRPIPLERVVASDGSVGESVALTFASA